MNFRCFSLIKSTIISIYSIHNNIFSIFLFMTFYSNFMMFLFLFQVRIDFFLGNFRPSSWLLINNLPMTQLKIGRYEFQNFQFLISTTRKIGLWKVLRFVFFVPCVIESTCQEDFLCGSKNSLELEENDPLCWFSRGVSTSGNSKHNFRRCPITICVQVHFNFHVLVQTSLNRKS